MGAGAGELHIIECVGYEGHPCGKKVETTARNRIRCDECALKEKRRQSRESIRRKTHQAADATEIGKKAAYQIMDDLEIKNPAVRDALWEQAAVLSPILDLPIGESYFFHGPHIRAEIERLREDDPEKATIETVQANGLLSIKDVPVEPVVGELINLRELYAVWAFFEGWRLQEPSPEQFEEYKKLRHDCKTDVLALGNVLGKDFHPTPHGDWANFLPCFNPDSLKAGYSEEDLKAWLAVQISKDNVSIRDFLLMCARNHYKSTFSIVWALTAVLCCPDIRILLCSITKDMSKKFMSLFQSYWKWSPDPALEKFQRTFPEYMIKPGDGKETVFISPMSHMTRVDKTAQITSLETGDTGSRFDLMLGDDVIDENGSKNPEQREKAMASYDEKWRFREAKVGFTITIGTPKHPEDLYAELVKRAMQGEEIAVHISPAWIVKSPHRELMALPKNHPRRLDIHDLTAEMVDVLFPSRWPFEALMKELGTTPRKERTFRSEYLIEWVSGEADEVLSFKEENLRQGIIQRAAVPEGETILVLDTARSQSKYADNSAITAMRLVRFAGRWVIVILDQDADKWDADGKASAIARFFCQYNPNRVYIEKPADWDWLASRIFLRFGQQSLGNPRLEAIPVDNSKNAKFNRVKSCADLIPSQMKFVNGPFIEDLFAEASRLDGKGTKMTSRNDRWDSISLGVKVWKIFLEQLPLSTEEEKIQQDAQATGGFRQAVHELIFGNSSSVERQTDRVNWEGRKMYQDYHSTGEIHDPNLVVEQEPAGPVDPRGAVLQAAIQKLFGAGSPYRA
jgi:hypothetical protein